MIHALISPVSQIYQVHIQAPEANAPLGKC
jgi:hypothetical protein